MSQPAYAITPATFPTLKPCSFIAANGTVAKVVVEPQLAAAAVSSLPAFYGGCTVIDLTARSSDGTARDVQLLMGQILTTQDATNTGAITLTAQNKLSRAVGSWIADGWQVGDSVMTFVPVGGSQIVAAIDGIEGIVTAVTAADLTVNGTPWAAGVNVLANGTRIVNVSQLFRAQIAINAGNTNAIANASLLNNTMDSAQVRQELKLGATGMLIAALPVAVSALPAQIQLTPRVARY